MIACVRILNFALRLEILEKPELDGDPLVLSPAQGERRKVIDCTPEATALYIRPGMSIRDVIAMSPAAHVVDTNPAREARVSQKILHDLEALSPFVEADEREAGCWYIDLVGLDRLLGPLPDIARRLLQTISPLLRPRVGIASGKFPARVAAGSSGPGAFQIVVPADTTAFLATASVTALPIDPATIQLLRQLGLRTLGELAVLSPSAVAARLGPEGRAAWELARGNDDSVVKAARHREIIREHLA
ncbi:MAG TPA: hypothetical protein VFQ54_10390, partial [Thermomicrobiales bacterium]|nr:hypothetical protein [Thermomicrobiales bacterium]